MLIVLMVVVSLFLNSLQVVNFYAACFRDKSGNPFYV